MVFQSPPEGRFPFHVIHHDHGLGVVDGIRLAVRAAPDDSDPYVRMTVPGVEDIHEFTRRCSFLVDAGGQEVDLPFVRIFVQKVHRKRVVDVVADVCLHDETDWAGVSLPGLLAANCKDGNQDKQDQSSFHCVIYYLDNQHLWRSNGIEAFEPVDEPASNMLIDALNMIISSDGNTIVYGMKSRTDFQ